MPQASCPGDQLIISLHTGRLPLDSLEALVEHLETCPDCAIRIGDLAPGGFLTRSPAAQSGLTDAPREP